MVDTLGQLMQRRRFKLGLTQEQVAERIGNGVRQSDISRMERNHVVLPRRFRMEQIAHALEIPLGELLVKSGWAGAEGLDDDTVPADEAVEDQLRSDNGVLQTANDRLEAEALDHASAMAVSDALVAQLRAILNGLHHAVVVVNPTGLIVLENTAYAVFAASFSDDPKMVAPDRSEIAEGDMPLTRAARGERFDMEFIVVVDGIRARYRAYGYPASTMAGGLLGVVTFEQQAV